jgi:hypothetical protein
MSGGAPTAASQMGAGTEAPNVVGGSARRQPTSELIEMSSKLSDEILAEALLQYSDLHTLQRLLALLTNRHTSPKRLAACLGVGQCTAAGRRLPPAGPGNRAPATDGGGAELSCCPFCLGDGQLASDGEPDRQHVKLVAIAASVALALVGCGSLLQSAAALQAPTACRRRVPSFGELPPDSASSSSSASEPTETPANHQCGTPKTARRPPPHDNQQELDRTAEARTAPPVNGGNLLQVSPGARGAPAPMGPNGAVVGSITCSPASGVTTTATTTTPTTEAIHTITATSSELELALKNLRLEREHLAAQVQQLKQCLDRLAPVEAAKNSGGQLDRTKAIMSDVASESHAPSASPPQQTRLQASPRTRERNSFTNRPLVLTSNMERMKRMDTLKRRKNKHDQSWQQQQQPAGGPLVGPSLPAAGDNENGHRDHRTTADNSAGQQQDDNPGLKQTITTTVPAGQAWQQSVWAGYHQSPAGNGNLSRGHPGSSGPPSGISILESADEESSDDDDGNLTVSGQVATAEGQQNTQRIDDDTAHGLDGPSATAASGPGRISATRSPVVAPGGAGQECDGRQQRRPPPQTTDARQPHRAPQLKQQQQSATAAYIYQSVRSSLVSLLGESVSSPQRTGTVESEPSGDKQGEQQRQQERRKRFSLNAFSVGLSSAIGSPFSSPKKAHHHGSHQESAGGSSLKRSGGGGGNEQQQLDSDTGMPATRKDFTGQVAIGTSQRQAQTSVGRGSGGTPTSTKRQSSSGSGTTSNAPTNCSCLKSSGSNQSVGSGEKISN